MQAASRFSASARMRAQPDLPYLATWAKLRMPPSGAALMAKQSQHPNMSGRRNTVKAFAKPEKLKHQGKLAANTDADRLWKPGAAPGHRKAQKQLWARYNRALKDLGHDERTVQLLSYFVYDTCQLMV